MARRRQKETIGGETCTIGSKWVQVVLLLYELKTNPSRARRFAFDLLFFALALALPCPWHHLIFIFFAAWLFFLAAAEEVRTSCEYFCARLASTAGTAQLVSGLATVRG